ncbi:MAG: hypothetical protein RML75_03775 [Cyanobacteriota bacterium SKYGB_h_bin112]|nr:hypothetical protein [Cyanobacteriota bacterium SKYGB_h_bin112]
MFQAYRMLQVEGISPEHLAIVGAGYSTPDRVGLHRPMRIALSQGMRWGLLLGTIGSFLGLVTILVLSLVIAVPSGLSSITLVLATGIITGFLGTVIGALVGFLGEGSAAGIYRHHLHQGHYLLMIEGSEHLVRMARDILNHYSLPLL